MRRVPGRPLLVGICCVGFASLEAQETAPPAHARPRFLLEVPDAAPAGSEPVPLLHEVRVADLEASLIYREGAQSAFVLPLAAERNDRDRPVQAELLLPDGTPIKLETGEQSRNRMRFVRGEQSVDCTRHRAFRGFQKRRVPSTSVSEEKGAWIDRNCELEFRIDRFGHPARVRLTGAIVGKPDAALMPRISLTSGGQELTVLDLSGPQELGRGLELPAARSWQTLTLVVRFPDEADPTKPNLVLSRVEIHEAPARDRVVVKTEHELSTLRIRYRAEPPAVVQDLPLEADGRPRARGVLLAGTAAIVAEIAQPFAVALNGSVVGSVVAETAAAPGTSGAARELAVAVKETAEHEVEVRSAGGPLTGRFWLVQPGTLAHRELDLGRAPLGRAVLDATRRFTAYVELDEATRPALLIEPGSTLALDLPAGPAGELAAGLALAGLGLPAEVPAAAVVEVSLVAGDGTATRLATRRVSLGGSWEELRVPVGARATPAKLELRATSDTPVVGRTLRVAVADPTLLEPEPGPRPANVLVYLIDTLRADHCSTYGYARPTTPALDALAREGIVFERAYAQAPWTRPSMASVLTGLLRPWHGAGKTTGVASEVETFAEALRAAGRVTAGFIANAHVHGGSFNFEQGFGEFVATEKNLGQTRSDEVNACVLPWLARHAAVPFFLYVHTIDPHAIYDPPAETRGAFAKPYDGPIQPVRTLSDELKSRAPLPPADLDHVLALYDEEILFNDRQFGRLCDELKRLQVWDDTLVVVLSDHGEEFQEHGGFGHGGRLWEELLRVPLVIKPPKSAGIPPGRVSAPVRQIDVLPTVLGRIGIAGTAPRQGVDLLPWVDGSATDDLWIYADEEPNQRCLLFGGMKLIEELADDGTVARSRLFDLGADPGEQIDLASAQSGIATRLHQRIEALLQEFDARGFVRRGKESGRRLSPREEQALRKLGYTGD